MRVITPLLASSLLVASASAQCEHELAGFDSFQDGWNGASLEVRVNGATVVAGFEVTADVAFASFLAGTGDSVSTVFTAGLFDDEIAYELHGGDGASPPAVCTLLASDGPLPIGIAGVPGDCTGSGGTACPSTLLQPTRPPNDDCTNATVLPPGFQTFTWDNVGATTDGADLLGSCDYGASGSEQNASDVWFRWTPEFTGCVYMSHVGLAGIDTRLTVYASTACPDDPSSVLACVDDEVLPVAPPFEAGLDVLVQAGSEVLIRCGAFDEFEPQGVFQMILSPGPQAILNQDEFAPDFPNPGAPGCGPTFPDLCNGDGGDQLGCTDCPCANNAAPGTIGGCRNSSLSAGRLLASGSPSISAPDPGDLRFDAVGLVPSSFAVLTSGAALAPQNMANPCFGTGSGVNAAVLDGLRCAVQSTQRHGGRPVGLDGSVGFSTNGWGGASGPPSGLAAQGGFGAGSGRFFQAFYRELPGMQCGTEQNTTQAIRVLFVP